MWWFGARAQAAAHAPAALPEQPNLGQPDDIGYPETAAPIPRVPLSAGLSRAPKKNGRAKAAEVPRELSIAYCATSEMPLSRMPFSTFSGVIGASVNWIPSAW